MSSSEEDENEFTNNLDQDSNSADDVISSGNEDDLSGPPSTFSVLKPFHVPGTGNTRSRQDDVKKNDEEDVKENEQSIDTYCQKQRKVPPPLPPKPKLFPKNDESGNFQQEVMSSFDAIDKKTACSESEVNNDAQGNLPSQTDTQETNESEDNKSETTEKLGTTLPESNEHSTKNTKDEKESLNTGFQESFVLIDKEHELKENIPYIDPESYKASVSNQEQERDTTETASYLESSTETDEYFDTMDIADNEVMLECKEDEVLESQVTTIEKEDENEELESKDHVNRTFDGDSNTESQCNLDSSFIVLGKGSVSKPYDSMQSFVASDDIENISMLSYTSNPQDENHPQAEQDREKDNTEKEDFKEENIITIQRDLNEFDHTVKPIPTNIVEDLERANKTDVSNEYYLKRTDQKVIDEDETKTDAIKRHSVKEKLAMFENLSQPVMGRSQTQGNNCIENSEKSNIAHTGDAYQGVTSNSQSSIHSSKLADVEVDPDDPSHNNVKGIVSILQDSFASFVKPDEPKEAKADICFRVDESNGIQETTDKTLTQKNNMISDEFEQSGYITPDTRDKIHESDTDHKDETHELETDHKDETHELETDHKGETHESETDNKDETGYKDGTHESETDHRDETHESETDDKDDKSESQHEISQGSILIIDSKSETDPYNLAAKTTENDAPPPPPRPPKRLYQEPKQQDNFQGPFSNPSAYQQQQRFSSMQNFYPYYPYQAYPQQYNGNPSMQSYQFEGGQFQYVYPTMGYQYNYPQFTSGAAGQPQANQQGQPYQTPQNPAAPVPEIMTQTRVENTKEKRNSQTNMQMKSDEKHFETPKGKQNVQGKERSTKKETAQKSLNPPAIHKSSSSPSRLEKRVPIRKSASVRTSVRASLGNIPNATPAGKTKGDKSPRSDTPPAKDKTEPVAEQREFYLFVSNLSPSCAEGMDNLNNYIEAGSSTTVIEEKVVYDREKASAVLVLTDKPDMVKLKEKTSSRPFEGRSISLCEIEPPKSIVVSCEDDLSLDSLELYFESRKSGGGSGDIDGDAQESEDQTVYIIPFKDNQVVQRVCAKESHVLNDKRLRVSPCYRCELGTIWDTKLHALPIPGPETIPIPKSHAEYLKKYCLDQLENHVKNNYCTISIQTQFIVLTCDLNPGVDNCRQKLKTWSDMVCELVKRFVAENVKHCKIPVDKTVWEKLVEFINSEQSVETALVIDLDKDNKQINLTGSRNNVAEYDGILIKKMAEIDRENRRTYNTKDFNTDLLSLPCIQNQIQNELKTDFSDAEIEIDEQGVKIHAVPEEANEMYVKIYEIIQNVKKEKYGHKYSDRCVGFANRKKAIKSDIDNQIKDAEIEAKWKLEHNRLTVEVAKGDPETTRHIIMARIKETEINLTKEDYDFMQKNKAMDFLNDLIEEYDEKAEIYEDDTKSVLIVYGLAEAVEEICKKVKTYIEENAIRHECVPCESNHLEFLKMHGVKAMDEIRSRLSEYKFEKLEIKEKAIKISISMNGMAKAKQEVTAMLEKIVSKDCTIKKVNVLEVVRQSQLITEVEHETRCKIVLQKEFEQFLHVTASDSHEPEDVQFSGDNYLGEKIVTSDQKKIQIKIVEGEIAKQNADVVVVAVSPDLNLKSGAASRNLMEVGGPTLQTECNHRYPKGIQHGEIAVIGSGNMKCSKVYLTSLKQWSESGYSEKALHKIVNSSLQKVSKYYKTSICFAAMGTGQLKYPAGSVARAMIQAVNEFSQNNPSSSVTEVKFALHPKDKDTIKAFKSEESNIKSGYTKPSFGYVRSKAPVELTAGPIKIQVVVASLEKQQVDCVLVGANETLNLDKSGACKALAVAAGGTTLQDECKNKYDNRLGVGQVAEIGSGKLPCKSVFLTVLPPAEDNVEEKLMHVLESFLQQAEAKKYQSVAIPALGTGYLKYSKNTVCECLFKTVGKWSKEHPQTTLQDVRFVMFSRDHDTIEIFQKHAARKANASNRVRHFDPSGHHHASKPLKEPSYRITSSGCNIRDVCLKVQIGDILSSDSDCIVSSCGTDFILNGAVASILKSRCPNLEADCKKKMDKFKKNGLAVTSAKGFPFKNIIHVEFQDSLNGWKKSMVKCLEKAKEKKWKTVAFPVLGSGQGIVTFKPECIAQELVEAIDDFTKKNPKCVTKEVRLIVFHKQPDMMKPILSAIHQQATKSSSYVGRFFGFIAEMVQDTFGTTRGRLTVGEKMEREDTLSSMSMTIYSDDYKNIQLCQEKLNEKLEKEYIKKKIDTQMDVVKSLTQEERNNLVEVAYLVNINLDDSTGVITIYGMVKDVLDVKDTLETKLRGIAKERHEKELAKMLIEQVKWFYEVITDTETKLEAYDERSNLKIETAFKANAKTCKLVSNDGTVFVVDFNQFIEYVQGDEEDQMRVVRKDILKSLGAALPEDWVEMDDKETIKVITIQQKDQSFKDVEARFMLEVKSGAYSNRIQFKADTLKITKISKIQNKTLYQQYVANKKKIENEKPNLPANMPVERQLWHGTGKDASSSIISHGFNRSYCGKNGVWFGEGVYFAKDASYSARGWLSGADKGTSGQTVTGYIFLVKALTGHFCKGVQGMRYLSPIDSSNPKVLYDSAVDNPNNPMEFLIFTDTQSYPEYLIEFTAVQK